MNQTYEKFSVPLVIEKHKTSAIYYIPTRVINLKIIKRKYFLLRMYKALR